jgi:hypothetical protein
MPGVGSQTIRMGINNQPEIITQLTPTSIPTTKLIPFTFRKAPLLKANSGSMP